jgi:hypothetical protein
MTWRLGLVLLLVGTLRADETVQKEDKKQYLIFPVTTQLQKAVLFSTQLRYFVVINGSAVVSKDGKILSEHLDVDAMRKDFRGGLSLSRGDTIEFAALHKLDPPEHATRLLGVAMRGWAQESGFEKPSYTTYIEREDKWPSLLKWTKGKVGYFEDDAKEDGVGNGLVNVYPIQTVLSRYYTDDANCLVEFARAFDKDFDGTLDVKMKKNIVEYVKSLELTKKDRLVFSIRCEPGAGKAADKFSESVGKELAKELGFTTHSVRSSVAR